MASISLNNLTKTFADGFTAVDNLNLDIKDGEFVVFVGPSGCGKSTTLRMIAGLESVSSGSITIGDREVSKVAPKDRDIAMVFQNYALYPHLSVEDNMGFALRMSKMPKDQRAERVLEAAKMLGLEDILNKKPGQLSGGQRQRVALGRAVVRKPAVFLFDEPLSNLDPDRRASTRAEIRRIQRELGTTTVYVTHDHEEAMALGDQIVLLDEGVLQQAGPPGELFDQPANKFVGTFLGAPKMNILPATIDRRGDRVIAHVDCIDSRLDIQLDDSRVPARADHGDQVSIGIRPHCIGISEGGSESQASFQGRVSDMERLGFAVDLHIQVGPHTLLARVSGGCDLKVGDASTFSFDTSMAHAFVD